MKAKILSVFCPDNEIKSDLKAEFLKSDLEFHSIPDGIFAWYIDSATGQKTELGSIHKPEITFSEDNTLKIFGFFRASWDTFQRLEFTLKPFVGDSPKKV